MPTVFYLMPTCLCKMPVLTDEWARSPRAVIKDLFERAGRGEGAEDGWGIPQFFESKLKEKEQLAAVPSLNGVPLGLLHDGCLVQYRAMVQDQFDPDFYFKVYHTVAKGDREQVAHCGMYSDLTHQQVNWDHPSNVMGDRHTLYCVPVPGETPWVKQQVDVAVPSEGEGASCPAARSHLKRKYEGGEERNGEEEDGCQSMEVGMAGENGAGVFQSKKPITEPAPATDSTSSQSFDLNFPLPGEEGLPCLVKVYRDCDAFSVGCVVHVVGVLSVDPALAPMAYSTNETGNTVEENRAHCPPPALVPRLHAIIIQALPHTNPLLPRELAFPLHSQEITRVLSRPGSLLACRSRLMDMLTRVLVGDALAAEYTLLHLLSSVYGRTEVMALGKFSLNLSQSPGHAMTDTLYQLFKHLLTKCFLLPLTLDNMNSWRFAPKKDYTSNRVLSSILQLSPGTHLLVDETLLTPGQLTQVGVANLTALGNMIQWQRLTYDFQFHSMEFNCDVPVLILSEGKSILKVDCHVPLQPSTSDYGGDTSLDEISAELRQYLTLCQGLDYSLTPSMQASLEEEFVSMRSRDPQLSGEGFHHLLCLGRLVALSHGSSSLDQQLWTHACQLHKERLERIASKNSD